MRGVAVAIKAMDPALIPELARWISSVDHPYSLQRSSVSSEVLLALDKVLAALDAGVIRAVEPLGPGRWRLNPTVLQAIRLCNLIGGARLIRAGDLGFFDHLPTKFSGLKEADLVATGVRVVPPAVIRRGSYLGRDVVVMPSSIGTGAYIDDGSMIDTWASVGCCAQVGRKVHVSVNAVVGDSSAQDAVYPAIVEDHCFVGAGVVIADGVLVQAHAVIGMGVLIDRHTPIYSRERGLMVSGLIPTGSVVVAGSLPSDGTGDARPCALIVKQVDAQTRQRIGVNELLRS
jgi:2,3,4,5-tetrahydropyridine-2,6-dicarboxylate N-succinyltransferase